MAGIPVRVHFTFLLLLVFWALTHPQNALRETFFITLVFGCVVLHEFGHALTAKGFGIKTQDIVLYPIGGVARLNSLGNAWQEFWITAAGPSVSLAIALLIWAGCYATGLTQGWIWSGDELALTHIPVLQRLCLTNAILFLFNLIPAFPMDGGRLLRSMLAGMAGYRIATNVAVWIGRCMAVLFIGVGLYFGGFVLILIGLFVFMASGAEKQYQNVMGRLHGRRARDVMLGNLMAVRFNETLADAELRMRLFSQYDMPVVDVAGNLIGILTQQQLFLGLQLDGPGGFVGRWMLRQPPVVRAEDNLEAAFKHLQRNAQCPVMVFESGRIVGLISPREMNHVLFSPPEMRA